MASCNPLHLTALVAITCQDTGQHIAHRVTTTIENGETCLRIADPEGLTAGVEVRDADPAIARHRLREWIAHQHVQAQLQRIPEARRRHERRRSAIRRMEGACPDCGNTGWVTHADGRGEDCRRCLG